jgi:Ca2+-binding RTX toxin-like protein
MTFANREIADLVALAEASYVHFEKLGTVKTDSAVARALATKDEFEGAFAPSQASAFVRTWRLKEHQENTNSGYSSTLFQSKGAGGEFVLAFRGTESMADLAADLGDIVVDGLAIDQIVDMYNDWQRLKAPAGTTYRAAHLQRLDVETTAYRLAMITPGSASEAYLALLNARTDIVIDSPSGEVKRIEFADSASLFGASDKRALGLGSIPVGAKLTVTGHSLGGHLAAAFSRLFPETGAEALTVNAAGFATGFLPGSSANAHTNIRNLFSLLDGASSFAKDRITNLYGSAAGQLVSMNSEMGLVQPGHHHEISTESFDFATTLGHGAGQMTDSANVHDLFLHLDSSLRTQSMRNTLDTLRPLFDAAAADPLRTFEATVNGLGQLLVPGFINLQGADDVRNEALYKAVQDIRLATEGKDARLIQLVGPKAADVDLLAKETGSRGLAARFALDRLLPYVADGLDYGHFNVTAELDLYDPVAETGTLTGKWVSDRATMLGWKHQFNLSDGIPLQSERSETYVFSDLDPKSSMVLTVQGRMQSAWITPVKVVFGSAQGETIDGGDLKVGDHLYGKGGIDTIHGRAGDDYIEGNTGDDTLNGDEGNDEVHGGAGADLLYGDADDDTLHGEKDADTLEGGTGRDRLFGGSGNDILKGGEHTDSLDGGGGHDVLNGGTGNDTLTGGAGSDSYLLMRNDGNDTIDDSDGLGELRIGADRLTGGTLMGSGLWSKTVNGTEVLYSFAPAADGRGDLFIQSIAGRTTVKHFRNGELGIVLEGTAPPVMANPATVSSVNGTTLDDNRNGTSGRHPVLGSAGSERVQGLAGRDEVSGGNGDDIVEGGAGVDVIAGNGGNDAVYADADMTDAALQSYIDTSATSLTAGTMPVQLQVTTSDWLQGGLGDDKVVGTNGNDIAFGGGGSDLLVGGAGHDILDGDDDYDPGDITTITAKPGVGPGAPFDAYFSGIVIHDFSQTVGAADEIHAGSGDDYVFAQIGDDIVWGDDGADTIAGGKDNDVVFGGRGNDRIAGDTYSQLVGGMTTVPTGDDYLDGGEGNDDINGDAGADTLIGGAGHDVLRGNNGLVGADFQSTTSADDGDDYLSGGAGTDTLAGDARDDTLYGGDDDDHLFGDSNQTPIAFHGNDYLDGGSGNDYLRGYSGNDTLLGGLGADQILGEVGDDYIDGGEPSASGTQPRDTVSGGDGDDIIFNAYYQMGDAGDDHLRNGGEMWGGDGDDVIADGGKMLGGNGADSLFASVMGSLMFGDAGADLLAGAVGADQLSGGDDNDTIDGNTGNDRAWGDAGDDMVIGGSGDDQLQGGAGNDALHGDAGDDLVLGQDGDDTLAGGSGKDYLLGGAGNDTYVVAVTGDDDVILDDEGVNVVEFADGITVDLLTFRQAVDASGNNRYVDIQSAGTSGHLTIAGGMDGAVAQYRFADGTTLSGAEIALRASADTGRPPKQVDYPSTTPGGVVNGTPANDTILLPSMTGNISGFGGNDALHGGAGDNRIYGGDGDDLLDGGGGVDFLDGGMGRDTYAFGRDSGDITISDQHFLSAAPAEVDSIDLAPGIAAADVRLVRDGNALVVVLDSGPTQARIQEHFMGALLGFNAAKGTYELMAADTSIEAVRFADGTAWNTAQIAARIEAGTANVMTGTLADDTFIVDSSDDVVNEATNAGTDTIQSSVSYALRPYVEKLVLTGALNSSAWSTASNSISHLIGNDGNNTFNGPGSFYNASGTLGGATSAGATNSYAVMAGGKGDDTYYLDQSLGGQVIENPGEGNDTLYNPRGGSFGLPANVENYRDTSSGLNRPPDDTTDVLAGNALDNSIMASPTNSSFHYYIDGGLGADSMAGSYLGDTYIVDNAGDRVFEFVYWDFAPSSSQDEVRSSVNFELPDNVEHLTLTGAGAIDGWGNGLRNTINSVGNTNDNALYGGLGDDYYIAAVNDVIVENPGEGTDTLELWGAGTRAYSVDELPANIEGLALGADLGASDLVGDAADNILMGNAAGNRLAGASGDDSLSGRAGDDTLEGGHGNDLLEGMEGVDTYVFGRDFGQDAVKDWSSEIDHLVFDSTVSAADVRFDAGLLKIAGTTDQIRLATYHSWANSDGSHAQFDVTTDVTFADGTSISWPDLSRMVVASFSHSPSDGPDALEGTSGDDTLDALGGADILNGYAGRDTLYGGEGADHVAGGDDDDAIAGGDGDDKLLGDAGNDTISGDAGNDAAHGGGGGDSILGGDGQDQLFGGAGSDTLDGAGDRDTLHGDDGDDFIGGGDGVDTIFGDAGNDALDGGSDTDTLSGGDGDDVLRAGDDDSPFTMNNLAGGSGNDHLFGADGVDSLNGEGGDDTLEGGGGRDNLYDAEGNNTLRGDDGDDYLQSFDGNDVLDGGAGADVLSGGVGRDSYVLRPGSGVDYVNEQWYDGDTTAILVDAALGPDAVAIDYVHDEAGFRIEVSANDGSDMLKLLHAPTTIALEVHFSDGTIWDAAAVRDKLFLREGTPGADALVGGMGDDRLFGFAGNDTLDGREGNDLLDGGVGADVMSGAIGNDTFIVDDAGDVVGELAGEGLDVVQSAIGYVLPANVERLVLTGSAAINATGNALDNRLTGNTGANSLDGKAGRDAMLGGAGNDTYVVDNVGDVVTEFASEGTDVVQSAITYVLGSDIENLTLTGSGAINGTGNALANALVGNGSANTLTGGLGDDLLNGGAGADTMKGGAGNDTYTVDHASDVVTELANEGADAVLAGVSFTLGANVETLTLTGTGATNGTGNTANNSISGNAAANVLNGGAGADAMSGGLGNDTYVVDNAGDVVSENPGAGTDLVQSAISHALSGNVENLTLTGTAAVNATGNTLANALIGNTGNNVLDGGAGADTLKGGAGNDTYVLDAAADVVTELANEGTDLVQTSVTLTLAANVENLTLLGTAATSGTGNALNNVLTGNGADNALNGGAGVDTMKGGAGNDTYVVDAATDVVTELAGEGTDVVQSGVTLTLSANVENLTLTGSAAIDGTGNALNNALGGNGAANVLNGGAGADTLAGGAGNDSYVVDNAADIITEAASAGVDSVSASVTHVLAANVEYLALTGALAINGTGNTLDNWLRGSTGVNTLAGMDGQDTLWGDAGNDALNGHNGRDLLQGGAGNDTLADTVGNNLLDGGAGTDTLTGGSARDMLIGGAGADTITSGGGADVLAFNKGDGADIVNASVGTDDTLTLGAGLAYADLKLKKSGIDLILDASNGDQITFKNWYQSGVNNKSILNLQVVADAMVAFNPAGADPLLNRKVVNFNFVNIVGQFDAALAANPAIAHWNLATALSGAYMAGSDTAAIGGDLAYDYGHRNSLATIGSTPAQAILANANFATTAQTLQAAGTLYSGTVRLS